MVLCHKYVNFLDKQLVFQLLYVDKWVDLGWACIENLKCITFDKKSHSEGLKM